VFKDRGGLGAIALGRIGKLEPGRGHRESIVGARRDGVRSAVVGVGRVGDKSGEQAWGGREVDVRRPSGDGEHNVEGV
jgi:hypothetical protein